MYVTRASKEKPGIGYNIAAPSMRSRKSRLPVWGIRGSICARQHEADHINGLYIASTIATPLQMSISASLLYYWFEDELSLDTQHEFLMMKISTLSYLLSSVAVCLALSASPSGTLDLESPINSATPFEPSLFNEYLPSHSQPDHPLTSPRQPEQPISPAQSATMSPTQP